MGRSNLTRLALGTAQFGSDYGIANREGVVTNVEMARMLEGAARRGIDKIDTAIDYGDSEARLGKAGIGGFEVATKLPAMPDDCPKPVDWVRTQVCGSLGRLGLEAVDCVLWHRPKQLLGPEGDALVAGLRSLVEQGRVRRVGISVYGPDELELLMQRYHFDAVQIPFNLVDRRLVSSGWLPRLKDQGIEIQARSPFLQGLLLLPRGKIPGYFSAWNRLWDRWHGWLAGHQVSAVRACMAFPLSFPEVDRIVVGAQSTDQVMQIADASSFPLALEWPDISSDEERLVNPSLWTRA